MGQHRLAHQTFTYLVPRLQNFEYAQVEYGLNITFVTSYSIGWTRVEHEMFIILEPDLHNLASKIRYHFLKITWGCKWQVLLVGLVAFNEISTKCIIASVPKIRCGASLRVPTRAEQGPVVRHYTLGTTSRGNNDARKTTRKNSLKDNIEIYNDIHKDNS